jgi:hypothetical protein
LQAKTGYLTFFSPLLWLHAERAQEFPWPSAPAGTTLKKLADAFLAKFAMSACTRWVMRSGNACSKNPLSRVSNEKKLIFVA